MHLVKWINKLIVLFAVIGVKPGFAYNMQIVQVTTGDIHIGDIVEFRVVGLNGNTLSENCTYEWEVSIPGTNLCTGTIMESNPVTGTTVHIRWGLSGWGGPFFIPSYNATISVINSSCNSPINCEPFSFSGVFSTDLITLPSALTTNSSATCYNQNDVINYNLNFPNTQSPAFYDQYETEWELENGTIISNTGSIVGVKWAALLTGSAGTIKARIKYYLLDFVNGENIKRYVRTEESSLLTIPACIDMLVEKLYPNQYGNYVNGVEDYHVTGAALGSADFVWTITGGDYEIIGPSNAATIKIKWRQSANVSISAQQNSLVSNTLQLSINEIRGMQAADNLDIDEGLREVLTYTPRIPMYEVTLQETRYEWSISGGLITDGVTDNNSVNVKWLDYTGSLSVIVRYGHIEFEEITYPGPGGGTYIVEHFIEEDQQHAVFHPIPNVVKSTDAVTVYPCSGANSIPGDLIEDNFSSGSGTYPVVSFQWQVFDNLSGIYMDIPGATAIDYAFTAPISASPTFIRRKLITQGGDVSYSNKIELTIQPSTALENINYVRVYDVKVPGIQDYCSFEQLQTGAKIQNTTYLDGLGRKIQTVSKQLVNPSVAGGVWRDLVQAFEYDEYGRAAKKYLPYPAGTAIGLYKTAALTDQAQYYANAATYNDQHPFTNTVYENSPLSRVTKEIAAGDAWASGGTEMETDVNTVTDNVQMLSVGSLPGDIPQKDGVFGDNILLKQKIIDENGKSVISFVNNSGQLILKRVQLDNPVSGLTEWISTYFIYDDFGRLRYTIEPEAVKYFEGTGNWDFVTGQGPTALDELCYKYVYDKKGRLILKKNPGAEQLSMLYDKRDRLVFTQDGNQADLSPSQWTAHLYDELDREVMVTLYNPSITLTQANIDNTSQGVITNTIINEGRSVVDLLVNTRDATILVYEATTSISFVADQQGSFESLVIDEFETNIDPTAATETVTTVISTQGSHITETELNTASVCTILKYNFYDDHSFSTAASFDGGFNNGTAYGAAPEVIPIVKSDRVLSYPTGAMVRVLGSNLFLTTTIHYNERGEAIQAISENLKSGTDIATTQYHWDGRELSSDTRHTMPNTGYNNYSVLTKYNYDIIGRTESIDKIIGTNSIKKIVSYEYDDMSRLKVKHLDPGYNDVGTTPDIETQNFDYNIQGQLIGINKDYALKTSGSYNKWGDANGKFFGLCIGYENNHGNIFTNTRLDGLIAAQVWNTMGDDVQRKYEYSYDDAGRLSKAAFDELDPGSNTWSHAKIDFTVTGSNNDGILYDHNGNLKNMIQQGIVIGKTGTFEVDNLTYGYKHNGLSNQLETVDDNSTLQSNNGILGDFKKRNILPTDDYVYDKNGNLVIDLNKNFKDAASTTAYGIKYNYLDKPEEIQIPGKGMVKIVYSADGAKLQRIFTAEAPANYTSTTTYVNEFVYQESNSANGNIPFSLSYILFEEGRIRAVEKQSFGNATEAINVDGSMDLPAVMENGVSQQVRGAYDFFIKDNLSNTRVVVTEEEHETTITCTMENQLPNQNDRGLWEQNYFQNPGNVELLDSRFQVSTTLSNDWQNPDLGQYVSKLNKGTTSKTIGPNSFIKVMAGDEITATADYFYYAPTTPDGGDNSFFTLLMQSFLGALVRNSSAPASSKASPYSFYETEFTQAGVPDLVTDDPATLEYQPKAYLTILFFDERLNFVGTGGGVYSDRAKYPYPGNDALELVGKVAPKNGYAYIYISNESTTPVYFNDLKINHDRKRILEENHYYPFGLKIATISSQKSEDPNGYNGEIDNHYAYQGDFSEFDDDLGWNDFELRNYDPQIGKFVQQDPYDQFSSSYMGMGNNPVNNIDKDGGWTEGGIAGLIGAVGGAATGYFIAKNNGASAWGSIGAGLGGAIVGGSLGYAFGETVVAGRGNFFKNIEGFYLGLIGNEGNNPGGGFTESTRSGKWGTVPNIWGSIGRAFGWVDGEGWIRNSAFISASTSGFPDRPSTDLPLLKSNGGSKIEGGTPYGDLGAYQLLAAVFFVENHSGSIPVSQGPSGSKPLKPRVTTQFIGESDPDEPWQESGNTKGSSTVNVTRRAISGSSGGGKKNNKTGDVYRPPIIQPETRVTVEGRWKEKVPVKKFKIFGITLFKMRIR